MEVGSSDLEPCPQVSKTVRCRRAKEARTSRSLYLGGLSKMSRCWYVTCWFEGIQVEALVDSGAEASVISSRVFKILHAFSYSESAPDLTTFKGIEGK